MPTLRTGTADIIGFGQDGVVILRNNLRASSSDNLPVVVKDFGLRAGGWVIEKHIRLIGDTTGDSLGDIIGFGHDGVWVAQNLGINKFGTLPVHGFGYGAGDWRV